MLNNRVQEVNLEEKSGQWLGGTLHSSGKDGQVVVSYSSTEMLNPLQAKWLIESKPNLMTSWLL